MKSLLIIATLALAVNVWGQQTNFLSNPTLTPTKRLQADMAYAKRLGLMGYVRASSEIMMKGIARYEQSRGLAVNVWGETNSVTITTNNNPVIEAFVEACGTDGFDTEGFIRTLAADGRICEMFGHCWERLTPETQSRIALYQNGREVVPCKCRICGKEETRTGDYK